MSRRAEEAERAQVELISRERKFRAAVEAGLREKVKPQEIYSHRLELSENQM